MNKTLRHAFLAFVMLTGAAITPPVRAADHAGDLVYIGTNTGGKSSSKGIYLFKFSPEGKLTSLGVAAEANNPGFLALDAARHHLYAVNEIGDYQGTTTGSLSAFSIDPATGKLKLLNVVSSGGGGPTHLVIDKTNKYVFAANYGAGSVAMFPILRDGRLGPAKVVLPHTGHSVDPGRQKEPHAHSIYVSPDNRFVVSADLGTDQIYIYRFNAAKGTFAPNDPPYIKVAAGSGPRHFAFDRNGKFAYVIQEMGSAITAFSWDAAHGQLTQLQMISTLPPDFKGSSTCAEIFIHPNGKFLYGSNRGDDSIAVFAIDPVSGTLTPVQFVPTQGKTPRNFGIDPTGNFLIAANQDSNSLVVFRIDAQTGKLAPTGEKVDTPTPICVVFDPQ